MKFTYGLVGNTVLAVMGIGMTTAIIYTLKGIF